MGDKTLDLAWQLEQERQQTAELRKQLATAEFEREHFKEQRLRAHALIDKIMDTVNAAYPDERQGDWDVLDQGVRRLVCEKEQAERELEAVAAKIRAELEPDAKGGSDGK